MNINLTIDVPLPFENAIIEFRKLDEGICCYWNGKEWIPYISFDRSHPWPMVTARWVVFPKTVPGYPAGTWFATELYRSMDRTCRYGWWALNQEPGSAAFWQAFGTIVNAEPNVLKAIELPTSGRILKFQTQS